MRIFTAIMVTAAVLATAVVSVRLHLQVATLRYRVSGLEDQRARAEREMRLAQAELEAAKAPRRLMERWAELHGEPASIAATERSSTERQGRTPVPPAHRSPAPSPAAADLGTTDVAPADPADEPAEEATR